MPNDTKEPQSYGSNADWSTGRTGQQVNEQKSAPAHEHRDFYDERREREDSERHQGGYTSDVQLADSAQPSGNAETLDEQPISKVTTSEGGAVRDSFFKRRDYK